MIQGMISSRHDTYHANDYTYTPAEIYHPMIHIIHMIIHIYFTDTYDYTYISY